MSLLAVTDVTKDPKLVRQVRKPTNNNPARVLVEWSGRIGVGLGTNVQYDDDNGVPLATVTSDVISAGFLFDIGCRRASDVIRLAIDGGVAVAGTDWTGGGANIAVPAAYDRTKASVRIFQIDVAVADTADHLEEGADSADLTGATFFGTAAFFLDIQVTFWTSDLTIGDA